MSFSVSWKWIRKRILLTDIKTVKCAMYFQDNHFKKQNKMESFQTSRKKKIDSHHKSTKTSIENNEG